MKRQFFPTEIVQLKNVEGMKEIQNDYWANHVVRSKMLKSLGKSLRRNKTSAQS